MNGYKSMRAKSYRARGWVAGEDYILWDLTGRCQRARELLNCGKPRRDNDGRKVWRDQHGRRVWKEYAQGLAFAGLEFLRDFNAA